MSGTDDWYRDLHEVKCKAKRRFHSAQSAKFAAQQEGLRRRKALFYYKCPNCSKFHLTSRDPREHDIRAFTRAVKQAFHGGHLTRKEMETAIREYGRKLKT